MRVTLPKLHPKQREIVFDKRDYKFSVNVCGTKFGKTLGFTIKMLYKAWTEPPGRQYAWLAPFYDTANIGMKYFRKLMPEDLIDVNKSAQTITLKKNGNIIFFRGVNKDPENATEGEAFHHVIMDEASKIVEQAFISARTTTTQTKGKIDLVSTPRGKNWFYQMYLRGTDPNNPHYISNLYPTHENPFIDPKEIEIARGQLPARLFQQYYMAEFLDDGTIFAGIRDIIFGDPINEQYWLAPEAQDSEVVIGVDWAKLSDFTVMGAITLDQPGKMVGYNRFQGLDYTAAIGELLKFANKFKKVRVIYHDQTGVGEAISDMLRQTPLPSRGIKFSAQSKSEMVNQLVLGVEQKQIAIPNWSDMLRELDMYEVVVNHLGNMKFSAPPGEHDDIVSMLLLAYAAYEQYASRSLDIKFVEDLPLEKFQSPLEKVYGRLLSDLYDD